MPQSMEMLGLLTVLLALGTAFFGFMLHRWGTEEETDSLVLLYRRIRGTAEQTKGRRRPKPWEEWPEVPVTVRAEARGRRRFGRRGEKKDEEGQDAPPYTTDGVPEDSEGRTASEPSEQVEASEARGGSGVSLDETAAPPIQQTGEPPMQRAVQRLRAVGARSDTDHMPLSDEPGQEGEDEGAELTFGQRFRRGLRRTRERIGVDMKEAFALGATPESFDRLEEALISADVGVSTATALVDSLRDRMDISERRLEAVIKEAMVDQLSESDRKLHLVRGRLSVWVVVGVNGTGKTTTIAKLASRAKSLGLEVSLAAADTFRAAATEQLMAWGERLGVEVTRQEQGADPGAVVFDAMSHAQAEGHQLLIVDTAGRLHTRKPLMDELQKVIRIIEKDENAVLAEVLLVVDATTGQNGIAQAQSFNDAVEVTGLALAKLDGSAKGGITFAVEQELGVPVKAVGVGEGPSDLIPFNPEDFVDALVGGWEET